MSRLGLLRSLLYMSLRGRQALILSVFAERCKEILSYGGGRDAFEWAELQRAFT
jgi:hypothetical protein